MASNPKGDGRIEDAKIVCNASHGLTFMEPKGGSHTHSSQADILTVPAHRPIKPI